MALKKHIPNTITCLNLLCGCIGVIKTFEGDLIKASYLIFLACLFDFLDGFAARLLHVSSPIGKELDSLADMVTFGLLPGLILFKLCALNSISFNPSPFVYETTQTLDYLCLLVPVFSALRLAKFNIDTRQAYGFIGVPTPANALLVASFPLIYFEYHSNELFQSIAPYIPMVTSVAMSGLLVSEIHLMALKFTSFAWKDNQIKYSFLFCALVLIVIFQFLAIPLVIALYIILSLFTRPNEGEKRK